MSETKDKEVRLWVDGCFDMFHYGHSNVIRQTKKLFPNVKLYVGVHTDEEIMLNKGPTVWNLEERVKAIEACKWVDVVVSGAPYVTSLKILESNGVDYCVHGEDLSIGHDGRNTYQELIDAGKYMTVKRTRGVSTTNIVNRLLEAVTDVKVKEKVKRKYSLSQNAPITKDENRTFFPSAMGIIEFGDDIKRPKDGDKIIYVDGTFDLFHPGHVDFLEEAKKHGDYLIVGLHDDATIKYNKGKHFPILNLHERVLSVLSCRYVDNVIIGAPFVLTDNMIEAYGIDVVVVGSKFDVPMAAKRKDIDPYEFAKKRNILKVIKSPREDLSLESIGLRIAKQTEDFVKRQTGRKDEKKIFDEIKKHDEKKEE